MGFKIIDRTFSGTLSHNIEDYPEGLVLVIDKPWRWTSADVIRKVKFRACRHFAKKNLKVGHAGTLDPLASGVLVVCIGAACKKAQAIQDSPKQYLAGVGFGAVTASYDREKEVELRDFSKPLTEESINSALDSMIGIQEQIAPLFSAKQIDGVRAYELARKLHRQGQPLDQAAASLLNISKIEITSMRLESLGGYNASKEECLEAGGASGRINVASVPEGLPLAFIRIDCSKGTYIRSIARDLGEKLGTGAFLCSLERTGCGGFCVDNAMGMEEVLEIFERLEA